MEGRNVLVLILLMPLISSANILLSVFFYRYEVPINLCSNFFHLQNIEVGPNSNLITANESVHATLADLPIDKCQGVFSIGYDNNLDKVNPIELNYSSVEENTELYLMIQLSDGENISNLTINVNNFEIGRNFSSRTRYMSHMSEFLSLELSIMKNYIDDVDDSMELNSTKVMDTSNSSLSLAEKGLVAFAGLVTILLLIIIVVVIGWCYSHRKAIAISIGCSPHKFNRNFVDSMTNTSTSGLVTGDPQTGEETQKEHKSRRLTLINGNIFFWKPSARHSKDKSKDKKEKTKSVPKEIKKTNSRPVKVVVEMEDHIYDTEKYSGSSKTSAQVSTEDKGGPSAVKTMITKIESRTEIEKSKSLPQGNRTSLVSDSLDVNPSIPPIPKKKVVPQVKRISLVPDSLDVNPSISPIPKKKDVPQVKRISLVEDSSGIVPSKSPRPIKKDALPKKTDVPDSAVLRGKLNASLNNKIKQRNSMDQEEIEKGLMKPSLEEVKEEEITTLKKKKKKLGNRSEDNKTDDRDGYVSVGDKVKLPGLDQEKDSKSKDPCTGMTNHNSKADTCTIRDKDGYVSVTKPVLRSPSHAGIDDKDGYISVEQPILQSSNRISKQQNDDDEDGFEMQSNIVYGIVSPTEVQPNKEYGIEENVISNRYVDSGSTTPDPEYEYVRINKVLKT